MYYECTFKDGLVKFPDGLVVMTAADTFFRHGHLNPRLHYCHVGRN
jgi:hypothetical protein